MKNSIKIYVDGKSFTLVGEEKEEHMKAVASYIDEKIKEIRKSAAAVKMDASLAYVLAALNVADDYFKLKEKNEELEGKNLNLTKKLDRLIPKLDEKTMELMQVKEQLENTQMELSVARKHVAMEEESEAEKQISKQAMDLKETIITESIKRKEMRSQQFPMPLKGGQQKRS